MTRAHIQVRGIYGGVPTQLFERDETLTDYGVNAIFLGSGSITAEVLTLLKGQGARVFAEFNTMHEAGYLKEHPEAAPIGPDGQATSAKYERGDAPPAVRECIVAHARAQRLEGFAHGSGQLRCDWAGTYLRGSRRVIFDRAFTRD